MSSNKKVGNYELVAKLGAGSYAQVFRGLHVSGAEFAVKVISKEKLGDPKSQENLDSEIAIMRDYQHPNIVRLYEHFKSARSIYLILEICPGGDLSKYIKKCKRVGERVAQGFLRQLADGLHFLASKNLIHRDLKPANVLLSELSDNATLKLADFGFAKVLAEASLAQTPCGTPLYMAPEIFANQTYDAKADLWSVGCIFFEMLVGTNPFKGSNTRELYNNIRTKSLTVPQDVKLSDESVLLLKRLLERDPKRRVSLEVFYDACRYLPVTNGNALPTPPGMGQEESQQDVTSCAKNVIRSEGQRKFSGEQPPPPPGSLAHGHGSSRTGIDAGEHSPSAVSGGHFATASPSQLPSQTAQVSQRNSVHPGTATTMMSINNKMSPTHRSQSSSPQTLQSSGHGSQYMPSSQTPQKSLTPDNPYYPRQRAHSAESGLSSNSKQLTRAKTDYSMVTSNTPQKTAVNVAASVGMGISKAINFMMTSPGTSPAQPATSQHHYQNSQHKHQHHQHHYHHHQQQQQQQQQHQHQHQQLTRRHSTGEADLTPRMVPTSAPIPIPQRKENMSGSNESDDDFVFIEQSAPHPWKSSMGEICSRESGKQSISLPSRTQLKHHYQGGTLKNLSKERFVAPPEIPYNSAYNQNYQQYKMQQSQEAESIMIHEIAQTCSKVCEVLSATTSIADTLVRDALLSEINQAKKHKHRGTTASPKASPKGSNLSTPREMPSPSTTATAQTTLAHETITAADLLGRPRNRSRGSSFDSTNSNGIDRSGSLATSMSSACALYLHCLRLLQDTMQRVASVEQQVMDMQMHEAVFQKLRQSLLCLFDQLMQRAEQCQIKLSSVHTNPSKSDEAPSSASLAAGLHIVPENLMYSAATRLASKASVEELLGNLKSACEHYCTALLLVEGIMLTASDPADKKVLRSYADAYKSQYCACQQRSSQLMRPSGIISPIFPGTSPVQTLPGALTVATSANSGMAHATTLMSPQSQQQILQQKQQLQHALEEQMAKEQTKLQNAY